MIKHVSSRPLSEIELDRRTQFLHDYGAVLVVWSEFELALEVKIARLARLEPVTASIILGGLSFGKKPEILYALLNEEGDNLTAPKIAAVINAARRNALVHSIVASPDDISEVAFVRRDIGPTYKVQENVFTAETFHEHFLQFRAAYDEAMKALGLKRRDLEDYGRRARMFVER